MENYIIIAVVLLIVGFAAGYVIKAKKQGKKCIGCPHANACASRNVSCSGCSNQKNCH